MIVLGIDPGAAGAGYCVWDSERGAPNYVGTEAPSIAAVHYTVIESGFIGRMGRKQMWGLGWDAGWRACEVRGLAIHGMFTVEPTDWRKALPEKSGTFKCYSIGDGDVIVARLRHRYRNVYGIAPKTEHEVEACGIAEAAAAILARPKAKDRKALKAVKR